MVCKPLTFLIYNVCCLYHRRNRTHLESDSQYFINTCVVTLQIRTPPHLLMDLDTNDDIFNIDISKTTGINDKCLAVKCVLWANYSEWKTQLVNWHNTLKIKHTPETLEFCYADICTIVGCFFFFFKIQQQNYFQDLERDPLKSIPINPRPCMDIATNHCDQKTINDFTLTNTIHELSNIFFFNKNR